MRNEPMTSAHIKCDYRSASVVLYAMMVTCLVYRYTVHIKQQYRIIIIHTVPGTLSLRIFSHVVGSNTYAPRSLSNGLVPSRASVGAVIGVTHLFNSVLYRHPRRNLSITIMMRRQHHAATICLQFFSC